MRVPFDQRDEKVNNLKLALNLANIHLTYEDAELINTLFRKVDELGGNMTLKDATTIQVAHEKKWREYYEEQPSKH